MELQSLSGSPSNVRGHGDISRENENRDVLKVMDYKIG